MCTLLLAVLLVAVPSTQGQQRFRDYEYYDLEEDVAPAPVPARARGSRPPTGGRREPVVSERRPVAAETSARRQAGRGEVAPPRNPETSDRRRPATEAPVAILKQIDEYVFIVQCFKRLDPYAYYHFYTNSILFCSKCVLNDF